LTTFGAGVTTTTLEGRYADHGVPTSFGVVFWATGGANGLPQAQRTRGTPWPSTSTAVPAWSTDW
jgi:hypothetical protein